MESAPDDRREKILGEIGDAGISLVGQSVEGDSPKPRIEKIRGRLSDGRRASVWWFKLPYRRTQDLILPPVSVGCEIREWGEKKGWKHGCEFCTVGKMPFERYLAPDEMLGFVNLALRGRLASEYWTNREGNIVVFFSNAGEPLLHYKAVAEVIRRLKFIFSENLFVSISTSGIAKGINELLSDDLKVQLRLSLHFPVDQERWEFMPMRDSVQTLVDLGVDYARKSGIPLMVKYILIEGVNDSEDHAQELINLLKSKKKNIWVRISRLNRYGGKMRAPSKWRRRQFAGIIRRAGLRVVPIWRGFATLGCDLAHYR